MNQYKRLAYVKIIISLIVLYSALACVVIACGAEGSAVIASNVQFKLPVKTSDNKVIAVDAVCLTGGIMLYYYDSKFVFIELKSSTGPGPIVVPPGPVVDPIVVTPIGKPMFALVIEETSQRGKYTGDQVKLIVSKAIPDYLHSVGGDWRVLDKDATKGITGPIESFIKEAKKPDGSWKELPYLVVSDKDGKLKYSGKLLANEAEVLALVKK